MEPETIEINSLEDIQPVDVDVEETVEVEAEPVVEVKPSKPAKKSAVKKEISTIEVKQKPISLVEKYNLKEVEVDHKLYKGKAFISPVEIPEMNKEYSSVQISGKYYYHK